MTRKVGIEVEFAGIGFDQASDVIARALGSEAQVISPHEHEFETPNGTYRLEVDFELLKNLSRENHEAPDSALLRRAAVGALELAASVATPLELVSPPLPVSEIDRFADLLGDLAAAGAQGTKSSMIYAFGVHFNPTADMSAESITAHLRAFLCLYLWLRVSDKMDLTRAISAFAKPFPPEYERHVLAAGYAPDAATLIDDYLQYNPTRNRALDLLPLLAEIDEERVRAAVDDERVNTRPTYHYRLPNSGIGEPGWSVLRPWRDWLEVERLAADPERLQRLCERRLEHLERGFMAADDDWVEVCRHDVGAR